MKSLRPTSHARTVALVLVAVLARVAGLASYVTSFDYNARHLKLYPTLRSGGVLEKPLEIAFGSEVPLEWPSCPNPRSTAGSSVAKLSTAGVACDLGIGFYWDRGLGVRRQERMLGDASGENAVRFGWSCRGSAQTHRANVQGVLFQPLADCPDNSTWSLQLPNGPYMVNLVLVSISHPQRGCRLNGHDLSEGRWGRDSGTVSRNLWVVVTNGWLVVVGSTVSCGAFKALVVTEAYLTAGNSQCWGAEFQYHTCCLTAEGRAACFEDESASPSAFTFDRCCRRQHDSGVTSSLMQLPYRPRVCWPPYCQSSCLGFGPDYYREPPEWVHSAPFPKPLHCVDQNVKLWPLSYSVPRHMVVECIPAKSADFALVHAGDPATYVFNDDVSEYYRAYREALFAVTSTKGGADCARHTEILGSGTLPYFLDLDGVPEHTMAHHHRGLLHKAKTLPGLAQGFLIETEESPFDASAWLDTASELLQWTTHRLTTDAMARYFLSVLGVPEQRFNTLRILYIWHNPPMPVFLLHGLREVLEPRNVVDFPRHETFYEPLPWPGGAGSRPPVGRTPGNGASYLSARWTLRRTPVLAEGEPAVIEALRQRLFDFVVLAQLPSDTLRPVEMAAMEHTPRDALVLVDAHDHMPTTLLEWAGRVGAAFKYNLQDTCA